MKKLEGRAVLCLILVVFLGLGTCVFTVRLGIEGGDWASFYANKHVYKNGLLAVGAVCDREGRVLLENDKDGAHYSDDKDIRKATLHVVGDPAFNIATGANTAFRSKMIGYNFVTGTKGLFLGLGRQVKLTIDRDYNLTAYQALAGRDGFVCVYNRQTGEILCLVSSPTFDPESQYESENPRSGAYINKAVSASFTPGSIFKLVTTAAAIENIDDLNQWTFKCTGSYEVEGEKITCSSAHGTVDIYGALAKSCNCAYASLTLELGSDVMKKYVDKLGLTDSYDINGIKSQPGTFSFDDAKIQLAWSGIGQHEDQLNPLSMMVYMGAIAGDGKTAAPVLLKGSHSDTVRLLSADTAKELRSMMRNNVKSNYGDGNFPGLNLRAKTGTAEMGSGKASNSWFCGYTGDYAFIVCVEGGGSGIGAAAPVANKVLQEIVNG